MSCPQGYIEHGLFRFTYGAADALVEFLHVDNFVQAHVKAAEALTPPESPVVRLTHLHVAAPSRMFHPHFDQMPLLIITSFS